MRPRMIPSGMALGSLRKAVNGLVFKENGSGKAMPELAKQTVEERSKLREGGACKTTDIENNLGVTKGERWEGIT